jgi:hypothetical protein
MAGPTSFAPIVDAAVDIVEESGGQYHVLIIIADGQVLCHPFGLVINVVVDVDCTRHGYLFSSLFNRLTHLITSCSLISNVKLAFSSTELHYFVAMQVTRSVDTGPGYLSPQERMTIDAIVAAR